jgi:hypothetical protein
MLVTLPFPSRKLLEKSLRFFSVEDDDGSSNNILSVLPSFL